MLVLLSFGLVLLATILLVIGVLSDALGLIYLSIGSSFLAAVVLFVAVRRNRPKATDASTAPTPLAEEMAEVTAPAPARTAPVPAVATPSDAPAADWMEDADWGDGAEFPIADYDSLTVGEIVPLLPQLYSDELDDVIAREQAGKARTTILATLAKLKETGTEADALEAAESAAEAAPVPAATPAAPAATIESDTDDVPFPIADYDSLSVAKITPLLAQLEADELDDVEAREVAGANRKSVLAEIAKARGGGAPAPAPAKKAAPAKRPAAKKAATKRTAKKAATKRTAKKAATKSAATKSTAKKASTKSAAKKSTAKKSTAKKAAKKASRPRFPIANYDSLSVADIRPRLNDLSDAQLAQVREREATGAGRVTILREIDAKLS